MSSTSRGYDRHKSDYYVTPKREIVYFLSEFLKCEPEAFEGKVLDPCAGGDEKHGMSYPEAIWSIVPYCDLLTMDIRKDSKAQFIGDYLKTNIEKQDTIITNPPFSLALGKQFNKRAKLEEGIIEKALSDVVEGGFVIMLLRLNFFGTIDRRLFWKKHMPKYCFVHHKRMGFIPEKPSKTDSIEYAHFVWQKGNYPEFTKLKVI